MIVTNYFLYQPREFFIVSILLLWYNLLEASGFAVNIGWWCHELHLERKYLSRVMIKQNIDDVINPHHDITDDIKT